MTKLTIVLALWGLVLYLCIRAKIPKWLEKYNTIFGKQETIRIFGCAILFLASWYVGIVVYKEYHTLAIQTAGEQKDADQ